MTAQSKTVPYPSRSASRWAALLLILLAFALRAYHLDFQNIWSDEGISILRSSQPLGQLLRTMPVEHVPGYFLLLHYWFPLAGMGDFALRFPSLIATVLVVAIVYRFGADLGSRPAGLAAALLLATNAFQVWYGQEARMYGWLLATGLASSWLLWRLLRDASPAGARLAAAGGRGSFRTPGRAMTFAGYVFCTAASLYLHHYGFLIPISQTVFMLYWLARTRDWRGFGRWALAGGSVIVLYLPWLPRFLGIFGFPGWRRTLDAGQLPWRYLAAYTAGDPMPAPWHNWLPWFYLALAFFGLYCWWRRNRDAALLLLFTSALPLAGALALALRKPDYHERYTIFITGPLMLLAGMGVVGIGQTVGGRPAAGQGRGVVARILRTGLAGLVLAGLVAGNGLALSHLYNDPAAQKADYKTPLHRIEQAELPGDVILLDGPDPAQIFLHYYQGSLPWQDLRPLQGAGPAEVDRVMAAATQGKRRGWLLRQYADEGPVEAWLAQHGWLASQAYYGGLFFSIYGLPGDTETLESTGIAFGPGLRLDGVRLAAGERDTAAVDGLPSVRAGDLLEATMRWRALGALPALKFSLRLRDATGYVWQSEDFMPQGGYAPTTGWQPGAAVTDRHALWLPADLPPGRGTGTRCRCSHPAHRPGRP
ncbi:MAG TPA: glycosyltransferase family 39 protein, partial [Anaerolineae bacterium]